MFPIIARLKAKWRPWLVTSFNYINKGMAITNPVQKAVLGVASAAVLFQVIIPHLDGIYYAALGILGTIAGVALFYLIGWWWDKQQLYHEESEWGNRRNPTLKRIDKGINGKKR